MHVFEHILPRLAVLHEFAGRRVIESVIGIIKVLSKRHNVNAWTLSHIYTDVIAVGEILSDCSIDIKRSNLKDAGGYKESWEFFCEPFIELLLCAVHYSPSNSSKSSI